jgi:hypothetical protein
VAEQLGARWGTPHSGTSCKDHGAFEVFDISYGQVRNAPDQLNLRSASCVASATLSHADPAICCRLETQGRKHSSLYVVPGQRVAYELVSGPRGNLVPVPALKTLSSLTTREVAGSSLCLVANATQSATRREHRYSVLHSKKLIHLGAPLRNRTVDLLLTMDHHRVPERSPEGLTCADTGSR